MLDDLNAKYSTALASNEELLSQIERLNEELYNFKFGNVSPLRSPSRSPPLSPQQTNMEINSTNSEINANISNDHHKDQLIKSQDKNLSELKKVNKSLRTNLFESEKIKIQLEEELIKSKNENEIKSKEIVELKEKLSISMEALSIARSTLLDFDDCFVDNKTKDADKKQNMPIQKDLKINTDDEKSLEAKRSFEFLSKEMGKPSPKKSNTNSPQQSKSKSSNNLVSDELDKALLDKVTKALPDSSQDKDPTYNEKSQTYLNKKSEKKADGVKSDNLDDKNSGKTDLKNAKETNTKADQLAAPNGIVGSFRKGLLGWFYPEVHDASENLGNKLEAYYDKSQDRWIFPGDEDSSNAQSLAPPPLSGFVTSTSMPKISDTKTQTQLSSDPIDALILPPVRSALSFSNLNNISTLDPILNSSNPPPSIKLWSPTASMESKMNEITEIKNFNPNSNDNSIQYHSVNEISTNVST